MRSCYVSNQQQHSESARYDYVSALRLWWSQIPKIILFLSTTVVLFGTVLHCTVL